MSAPAPQAHRAGRPAAGLTLVELLVAMTLFAILSMALFGSLRFGAAAWQGGTSHSEAMNETMIVQSVLRRLLVHAKPPLPGRRDPNAQAIFEAGPERLVFVAPLSQHVGLGGLYRFELSKVPDGQSVGLLLTWQLYRPNDEQPFVAADAESEGSNERLLIAAAADIAFRYYGSVEADRDPDWLDEWPLDGLPPQLVAVDIGFAEDDARSWPELVVAPARFQHGGRVL